MYSFVTSVKGKERAYDELAFYNNGSLTKKAISILDSGALLQFSPVFGNPVLDLEAHIGNGLFAKDILHHACLDTLGIVSSVLSNMECAKASNLQDLEDMGLMSVNSVLSEMGFDPAPKAKDGSPPASV